jgi:DNA-binding NtrC family response regulator
MVNMTDSTILMPDHLPERIKMSQSKDFISQVLLTNQKDRQPTNSQDITASFSSKNYTVLDFEKSIIAHKLKQYGYGGEAKKRIAQELGISLSTLYNRIRFFGLNKK